MATIATDHAVGRLPGDHYAERVLDRLAKMPDQRVVSYDSSWVSARELRGLICGAVDGLARLGVGRDDTVAALTEPNHPLMLVVRYAANLLGARIVYIRAVNPRQEQVGLSEAARVGIIRETGAQVLFVDRPSLAQALSVARSHGGGLRVCGFDLSDVASSEVASFAPRDELPAVEIDRWDPSRIAAVIYTSGTTGAPKGVCMSFGAWESMVRGFARSQSRPGMFLAVTPISQAASTMLDGTIAAGGAVILHRGFDCDAVLDAISGDAVTGIYMAVPHLYQLLDNPRTREVDRSKLTCVIYSGTPASPRRMEHGSSLFGMALIQSYGTTEAGPISVLLPMAHRSPDLRRTVGRPLPGVRVRICDPETRRPLDVGMLGEVLVRSPTIMSGYLGEPAMSADGWLRTGDLGTIDARGYLSLSGRVGDMIKCRGIKIHPAAVAETLLAHAAVTNAYVFGVRGTDDVEEVHAAVALYPGAEVTAAALRFHVEAQMTALHSPDVITIWTSLPLMPTGKPDRMRLMLGEQSETERIIWHDRISPAAAFQLTGAKR